MRTPSTEDLGTAQPDAGHSHPDLGERTRSTMVTGFPAAQAIPSVKRILATAGSGGGNEIQSQARPAASNRQPVGHRGAAGGEERLLLQGGQKVVAVIATQVRLARGRTHVS